jgi:hypothetical protein
MYHTGKVDAVVAGTVTGDFKYFPKKGDFVLRTFDDVDRIMVFKILGNPTNMTCHEGARVKAKVLFDSGYRAKDWLLSSFKYVNQTGNIDFFNIILDLDNNISDYYNVHDKIISYREMMTYLF